MHITYEGKEFTFDLDDVDLTQASIIYDKCGLTLLGLETGLYEGHPAALRAVYWLMLCQSGEVVDIDRVNFKIVKFAKAVDAAAEAEAPADAEPEDPKEPESSPA